MVTKNLDWNWRNASYGLLLALPGAFTILTLGHVKSGIELCVGMLVAVSVGVQPKRSERKRLLIIGVLFAASIMFGAIVAQVVWVAIAVITVVAFGAAQLAARRPFGLIAMSLCLPLMGIGFSFDPKSAGGFALLLLLATSTAYLVALCFPEADVLPAAQQMMSRGQARQYALALAATAGVTATIGFAASVDHPGWVVGAALLVMRPLPELQEIRSVGRILAVFTGAFGAATLVLTGAPTCVYGIAAPLILIGSAATHASRWYIGAGFTTFLVIALLTYGETETVGHYFWERTLETLIGVGVAYCFGLLLPKLLARRAHSA